jgi:hypothetical protein
MPFDSGGKQITMSLEARNLAYNNVEHVGPENARMKTEGWAAASKTLREQRPQHLDLAYGNGERNKWDLYPANDPKAPCFVHIHGGYWQRGSKEIFACLSEGPLARGWSAALCGYTLAPEASLTQITNELKSAFDWLNAKAGEHGIQGPIIITGWSAGGHLTSFILDHPKVAAGLAISGVFDLGALRDSPHVNDKVKLSLLKCPTPKTIRKVPGGVRTSSPATNGIAAFAVTASCTRRWYANTLLMNTTRRCRRACMSTSTAQFGSERNSLDLALQRHCHRRRQLSRR